MDDSEYGHFASSLSSLIGQSNDHTGANDIRQQSSHEYLQMPEFSVYPQITEESMSNVLQYDPYSAESRGSGVRRHGSGIGRYFSRSASGNDLLASNPGHHHRARRHDHNTSNRSLKSPTTSMRSPRSLVSPREERVASALSAANVPDVSQITENLKQLHTKRPRRSNSGNVSRKSHRSREVVKSKHSGSSSSHPHRERSREREQQPFAVQRSNSGSSTSSGGMGGWSSTFTSPTGSRIVQSMPVASNDTIAAAAAAAAAVYSKQMPYGVAPPGAAHANSIITPPSSQIYRNPPNRFVYSAAPAAGAASAQEMHKAVSQQLQLHQQQQQVPHYRAQQQQQQQRVDAYHQAQDLQQRLIGQPQAGGEQRHGASLNLQPEGKRAGSGTTRQVGGASNGPADMEQIHDAGDDETGGSASLSKAVSGIDPSGGLSSSGRRYNLNRVHDMAMDMVTTLTDDQLDVVFDLVRKLQERNADLARGDSQSLGAEAEAAVAAMALAQARDNINLNRLDVPGVPTANLGPSPPRSPRSAAAMAAANAAESTASSSPMSSNRNGSAPVGDAVASPAQPTPPPATTSISYTPSAQQHGSNEVLHRFLDAQGPLPPFVEELRRHSLFDIDGSQRATKKNRRSSFLHLVASDARIPFVRWSPSYGSALRSCDLILSAVGRESLINLMKRLFGSESTLSHHFWHIKGKNGREYWRCKAPEKFKSTMDFRVVKLNKAGSARREHHIAPRVWAELAEFERLHGVLV